MAFDLRLVSHNPVQMKHNPPLIRRTFLQERFDILIKKQRNGSATFNDLTELDDIVNRDPAIRESILEEMHSQDEPPAIPPPTQNTQVPLTPQPLSVFEQIKRFFLRLVTASLDNRLNPATMSVKAG